MSTRHPLKRADIDDYAALADELSAALGRPVALSARAPTDEREGVLIVLDAATGEPVDVDDEQVASVVTDHTPVVHEDPADALVRAVEGASTVAQLRDALVSFGRADRGRFRPRPR